MSESVIISKELLRDLYAGLVKVKELMDKESLERIRKAEEEYRKGEYVTVKDSGEVKKLIE